MGKKYQGRWNVSMLIADYCWPFKRDLWHIMKRRTKSIILDHRKFVEFR
jgi:hypothetical protein